MSAALDFRVSVGLEKVTETRKSSNELVLHIWRRLDTGNGWDVRYEGVWLRVSAALGLRVSIRPEMVTET